LPELSRQLRQSAGAVLAGLFVGTQAKLIIHTLGRAEVIVNGHIITNSEWQTQISRNIFLCLLAHRSGLTKEEIGELFWPDATLNETKTRFKNAIYRLRSALNQNVILFDNEIYRFNWTLDYEYDLELFLQQVALGDRAIDPVIQVTAYQSAIQLYRGDYLPDVDEPWTLTERERIHRIFVDKILKLARLQFNLGDLNGSLENCHRALLDDPCLEEAHRLAMRIYAATGNRAAIVRQFAQCRQALQDEIDAPPSSQTEDLYTTLMRS
jgi:two-component SAPR family response regulator